jgi:hypothetical protein
MFYESKPTFFHCLFFSFHVANAAIANPIQKQTWYRMKLFLVGWL